MRNREKVIHEFRNWCEAMADECPVICLHVLDLLEEQEPIEPVDDGHGSLICGNQGYECGCVGRYDLTTKVVEKYCNFCPECGRKVKWDEIN